MDSTRFDGLVRSLAHATSRRRSLGVLLGGTCALLLGGVAPRAASRRPAGPRKKKKCKHGKTRCGTVCVNTATDPANCGGCGNQCPAGQICLSSGCTTCASVCPLGCCDANQQCQSGGSNQACGTGGAACQSCVAPQTCGGGTPGVCGCTPDCVGKCAGGADGCGGTCTGGCAGGRVCLSNGTCAVPCPNGGPDCSACGNRCISTSVGDFCSEGNGSGSCNSNADCPTGRVCDGVLCEIAC